MIEAGNGHGWDATYVRSRNTQLRLLEHLAVGGLLEALARLHVACEVGEPARRPVRRVRKQQPVVGVGDRDDHRRVGARVVLLLVALAPAHPTALAGLRGVATDGAARVVRVPGGDRHRGGRELPVASALCASRGKLRR